MCNDCSYKLKMLGVIERLNCEIMNRMLGTLCFNYFTISVFFQIQVGCWWFLFTYSLFTSTSINCCCYLTWLQNLTWIVYMAFVHIQGIIWTSYSRSTKLVCPLGIFWYLIPIVKNGQIIFLTEEKMWHWCCRNCH